MYYQTPILFQISNLSLIDTFVTVFVGSVSALIAALLTRLLWNHHQRPILGLERTFSRWHAEDGRRVRLHRLTVTNSGRSAARNCRPRIELYGEFDGKTYEMETTSHWIESGNPATITINAGESVSFALCRVNRSDSPPVIFPVDDGWGLDTGMIQRYSGGDVKDDIHVLGGLPRNALEDGDWSKKRVSVSSETAKMVSGRFKIKVEKEDAGGGVDSWMTEVT